MQVRGKRLKAGLGVAAVLAVASAAVAVPALAARQAGGDWHGATATPIQHVVVIFQENVSFDH